VGVSVNGSAAEAAYASPLYSLLPDGRIRPGTAVSAGGDMPLLLALAAAASVGAVGWAAVGLQHLAALAAQEAGLDLASGMRIDDPGRQWAQVLVTVAEAVNDSHDRDDDSTHGSAPESDVERDEESEKKERS
jgi:hypothetical protein